jgi:hypothetical protein
VKILSTGLKLAFVAAVIFVLAGVQPLSNSLALAQPVHGAGLEPNVAAHKRPQALFDRSAASSPEDADQARRLSAGPVIGLICAIAASSVALGIAFGIRRRIDRIAGPDPDKADDD